MSQSSRADGTFRIVAACPSEIRPDPYLVWEPSREEAAHPGGGRPSLRLVS